FRMLGSIASGKVFDELLSPFWTQGFSYSDAPPFGPNAWTWDAEAQIWKALTDQRNNTLEAGSGFLYYMFSDDDNNGTADGFPKTITSPASLVSVNNFDYLVNTDIVYPFTELPDNDFFLVSNPYTSEIDWDAVSGWTKTNLSNTIYIWSDADNAWLTWNGSSGSKPDEGVIAPFQSFFVQANGGPGSLTIKEGAKTSTSGSLHKSGTTEQEDVVGFELVAETEEAKSVAFLTLHPEGTTERDIYEGMMLNPLSSKYLQLGLESKMNKEIYSIYSIPRDYSSNLTIPLYLNGMNISSEADFHVKIPEGFEPKWEFILRDTQTGRETQLTNEEKVKVTVDINNSEKLLEGILSNLHNDQEKGINQESRYELILNSYINTSVNSPENDIPENVELHQNYPNPFNPTTTIHYQLPSTDYVKLEVFDLMGRKVTTLVSKRKEAGSHHVSFDAQNLASGTYIYQLRTDETVITKKLTLIK
ncbi:MAG: T9SS type A sorting domain-containing protein, partial [Gracilimonas sp.]|nr:T9SS type A sorting domain-containing protein [Gracilimonas sp.]